MAEERFDVLFEGEPLTYERMRRLGIDRHLQVDVARGLPRRMAAALAGLLDERGIVFEVRDGAGRRYELGEMQTMEAMR
jgi:hypothetical protein